MDMKGSTSKTTNSIGGKSTLKQFLLSMVATTISIALTFGTAAWLENHKKEKEKREMVMMILYDLAGSLEEIKEADTTLRKGFEQQLEVAAQPELLEKNPFVFTSYIPVINYTETVERIFSSNIETINTIGNVIFAEDVSMLYQLRRNYKEEICQKFMKRIEGFDDIKDYDQAMSIDYLEYIGLGGLYIDQMEQRFNQCMQMMDVSDADLQAYRQKRQKMTQTSAADSIKNALLEEAVQNNQRQNAATEKGKAKLVE